MHQNDKKIPIKADLMAAICTHITVQRQNSVYRPSICAMNKSEGYLLCITISRQLFCFYFLSQIPNHQVMSMTTAYEMHQDALSTCQNIRRCEDLFNIPSTIFIYYFFSLYVMQSSQMSRNSKKTKIQYLISLFGSFSELCC